MAGDGVRRSTEIDNTPPDDQLVTNSHLGTEDEDQELYTWDKASVILDRMFGSLTFIILVTIFIWIVVKYND